MRKKLKNHKKSIAKRNRLWHYINTGFSKEKEINLNK